MPSGLSFVARHPVASFFALSYLTAWAVWISAGILAPGVPALVLPGAWAPTIAALIVTAANDGKRGVRALAGRVLIWRVGWTCYLVAVLGMASVAALAVVLHVALGGTSPDLETSAAQFGIPPELSHLLLASTPHSSSSARFSWADRLRKSSDGAGSPNRDSSNASGLRERGSSSAWPEACGICRRSSTSPTLWRGCRSSTTCRWCRRSASCSP